VFIGDCSDLDSDITDIHSTNTQLQKLAQEGIFRIVVATNENFYTNLPTLKSSSFFVNYYCYNKHYAVILFKCLRGASFAKFLDSKYSQMFSKEVLELAHIKSKFLELIPHEYKVLTADLDLKLELCKQLADNDTDQDKLFDTIQELDSKLDLYQEFMPIPNSNI